jgi:hypothetical protein
MHDGRPWLNAIGIFAATSFVIFYFDLSPLWYSAALLAWIVRRHATYRVRGEPSAKAAIPVEPAPASDHTAQNS